MAGYPVPFIKFREDDANGFPLAGGKLWSYAAGTSTPLPTYYNQDCSTSHANTNPTILDASGRADIWVPEGIGYKFVLTDALGNTIYTQDNVQVGATQTSTGGGGGGGGGGSTSDTTIPPGTIVMFGGQTAPDGWLLCDGSVKSGAEFPKLRDAIGTTFGGAGNNFNLPDLRQRFPLGKAQAGTGVTLGEKDGNINHVHAGGSHTHTTKSHQHGMIHTHTVSRQWSPGQNVVQGDWPSYLITCIDGSPGAGGGTHIPSADKDTSPPMSGASSMTDTGATTVEVNAGGVVDSGPANPPYIVLNFIIKT